jgi:hypothetical protein
VNADIHGITVRIVNGSKGEAAFFKIVADAYAECILRTSGMPGVSTGALRCDGDTYLIEFELSGFDALIQHGSGLLRMVRDTIGVFR